MSIRDNSCSRIRTSKSSLFARGMRRSVPFNQGDLCPIGIDDEVDERAVLLGINLYSAEDHRIFITEVTRMMIESVLSIGLDLWPPGVRFMK